MKSKKSTSTPRHGLARILSKQGLASRTQAAEWIRQGRVSVNGQVVCDPEFPVQTGVDVVSVAGQVTGSVERIVLMLNKPRGLVTTTKDEQDRETVYSCFAGAELPWIAPVGRLDKASEGLLLFTNDPQWAASITSPETGPDKTYHVQINAIPDEADLQTMLRGVNMDGEMLSAKAVKILRSGEKNAWLEIVLDEGKNRQIRRLLSGFDYEVLRLIRVAIGSLQLGDLAKGQWRVLSALELSELQSGKKTDKSANARK
ncbi:MAG: rRNA pseudouridine synthase [Gammaproteobacteria bacterium]|nr:rRNA pseudouridine synthase [Gammaproteobacteria bacterium]